MTNLVLALTLTLWYEGRGEGMAGVCMIADTIYNRAGGNQKNKLESTISKPYQYSCWNGKDFDLLVPPVLKNEEESNMYNFCCRTAYEIVNGWWKPSTNATHYFNPSKCSPKWAGELTDVFKVGNHIFGTTT